VAIMVRFVRSGDSFGSGGRFQTCILVDGPQSRFAIDFGTSSLIALAQQGLEHNSIDAILLTHLHGDHCGGVSYSPQPHAAVRGCADATPATLHRSIYSSSAMPLA
jgi:ribonuclease BN (tRNA processing enzyme)